VASVNSAGTLQLELSDGSAPGVIRQIQPGPSWAAPIMPPSLVGTTWMS
jgi:hypothetical protein